MFTRILVLICLVASLVYAILDHVLIAILLLNLAIFNQLIVIDNKLNDKKE